MDQSVVEALTVRFEALRAAARHDPYPSAKERRRRISVLERLLRENMAELAEAISADFGTRSLAETKGIEFFPMFDCLRYARRQLGRWMRPRRRATGLWFLPATSQMIPQPLGAVGIVAPWNYPLLMAVGPLADALAAGNRAMIKMSEHAPRTAAMFGRLVAEYFQPDEVSVMHAAASNLTPVTLELGGKSPAIVAPGYPLAHAVERIMYGKCINAGQTCIAPDYVLVPAGSEEAFVAEAQRVCARFYPDMAGTTDYASIIDERHFERLRRCLDEAAADGAEVIRLGPEMPPESRRLAPHLLLGSAALSKGLQQEIFGPILPVVGYRDVDGAIAFVNARPRPLALYLFDRDSARVERWLRETVAGGVSVNDTIMHIAQHSLPFGGVGPSGMGRYHGRDGFDTFSHQKAVFRQSRLAGVALFNPPYGRRFQALLKLVLRL